MIKALIAFAVAFVVTFCVITLITNSGHDEKKTVPTTSVSVIPSPTPTPTPTASKSPVEEQTLLNYGQTYQYNDGLRVTVSAPKDYPKDPTVKMSKKYYKYYTVTVKNTVRKSYETNYFDVNSTAGDSYGEYTATEGNGFPTAPLAKGESLTFVVAFGYDSDESPRVSFNPFVDPELPDILTSETVTWGLTER